MKRTLISALVVLSTPIFAQESENIFNESFAHMFELEPVEPYIPEGIQGPLNPAVPLDGGLTALLVAGGAVGYRTFRARQTK